MTTTAVVDKLSFEELYDFDPAAMRRTPEGFVVAQPRVARTGIQLYMGAELGHTDMETVRVYRPEAEVFHKDSLKTMAHRTITLGHPKEMVDAKNWRKHAVGMSGDEVVRDGDCVRVPMVIMDASALDGTSARELSVGYGSDIVWQAGVTDSGEAYDAIQRNIRVNHIAIVPQARGGSRLRLGDVHANTGDKPMATSSVLVDGLPIQLPEMEANIVSRALARANDEIVKHKDENGKLVKQLADVTSNLTDAKKKIEAKDGEILVLKKEVEDGKLTPAVLDAHVAARAAVLEGARRILGDAYNGKGKTEAAIMREAVEKHLGDAAKDLTDGKIDGAFLAITAKAPPAANGARALGAALSAPFAAQDAADPGGSQTALAERDKRLADAWKNKATVQ